MVSKGRFVGLYGITDKRDCRASALKENLYRDVNDAVQKAFTFLRGNI